MKCFSYLLAAVTMLLLVVGCDSPLNYVPEDADFVFYGNTSSFMDSKAWEIMKSSKDVEKALKEIEKKFDIDEEECGGKVAVWGSISKKEGVQFTGAVIILDNGKAEDVFKAMKKDVDKERLEKDDVDDCEAFSVKKWDGKTIDYSVVLVDDKTLHITIGDDPQIFEKDSNDAAKSIDKSAIFAAALVSPEVCEDFFGKEAPDLDGIGVTKIEVFADGSEVSANISVDISDVD